MTNYSDRGGWYRTRWITPSEICIILHILRKPNSIIALLYVATLLPCYSVTLLAKKEKWLRDVQVENASFIDWKEAYTIAFNFTAPTKLRTFHFKVLHRRIATNDFFLQKINLKQFDKFCFCQREIETIFHLFMRCSAANVFWNDVTGRIYPISFRALITQARPCKSFRVQNATPLLHLPIPS